MQYDAHQRPPDSLRVLFKRWQKSVLNDIDGSEEILDLSTAAHHEQFLCTVYKDDRELKEIWQTFCCDQGVSDLAIFPYGGCRYEVKALPGLFVYPALLPLDVQINLLDKLLHRELSEQLHKTNLQLHYDVPYHLVEQPYDNEIGINSFFGVKSESMIQPKDASAHRPLSIKQMLERKLRWMTLGGQYDWTAKVYPQEKPPPFPEDVSQLLRSLWPDVDAQAAIVNLYTPGDTLSVHRDVSEECDRGLISLSIGCDAIFIIGNEDGTRTASLRLKSGDALLMSGKSRFAWHAVPKIMSDTCPSTLQDWPATSGNPRYEVWKGWLSRKRINVNIRQMRLESTSKVE